MYEAVQQRATVVTEGWTGVSVDLKHVLTLQVLKEGEMKNVPRQHTHLHTGMQQRGGAFRDKPIRFLHARGDENESASWQGCACAHVCLCVHRDGGGGSFFISPHLITDTVHTSQILLVRVPVSLPQLLSHHTQTRDNGFILLQPFFYLFISLYVIYGNLLNESNVGL